MTFILQIFILFSAVLLQPTLEWTGANVEFSECPLSDPWISHVYTSLVVPTAPQPQVDDLLLYPGLYTTSVNGQGLVQTQIGSFANPAASCGGSAGEWCVVASYYNYTTGSSTSAISGTVPAGAAIVIEYTYNYIDGSYTQITAVNDHVLTYETAGIGAGYIFAPTVECDDSFEGTVPAHTYWNTTIVLANQKPDFDQTVQTSSGNVTDMHTLDGGKTWFIGQINLDAARCGPSAGLADATIRSRLAGLKASIAVPVVQNGSLFGLPRGNSSEF
ncbi:MAG: hypothetical protein M1821_007893 [Bathelium mastoideum]|nr:MAG: hypothetical protein M1821_007893 [Bathelium mastoideum]